MTLMRVGCVIPYFEGAWEYGGPVRSASELARALVGRGHQVRVITTDSAGRKRLTPAASGPEDGLEVLYCRNLSNRLASRHRLFMPMTTSRGLARILEGCDVVHIHEVRSFLTVLGASAARRLSIPFLLSPHGGLPHIGKRTSKTIFDSLWGKRILAEASTVFAVSSVEAEQARSWGVSANRITELPNPIAVDDYRTLPAKGGFKKERGLSGGRLVLFMGRLNRIKGADILIRALASANLDDTRLVIAGADDGQEAELRRMADAELQDRVTFTGFLTGDQKVSALVDADIVVMPSRYEIFGMTALDALACWTPVLLSSSCGAASILEGKAGVNVFRNEDPADLSEQLRTVLDRSEDASGLPATRDYVIDRFAPASIAAMAESSYEKAIMS